MIKVKASHFYRVAMAKSSEATRYYLNGVCIARCAKGGAELIATDGNVMLCARDETGEADSAPVIVAADKPALAAMRKAAMVSAKTMKDAYVVITGDKLIVTDNFGTALYIQPTTCIIDGSFPDWRRVVPQDVSQRSHGTFDAKLLSLVGEALAPVGSRGPHTIDLFGPMGKDGQSNDRDPCYVVGQDRHAFDAFAVVMPMSRHRSGVETCERAAWLEG